MNPGVFHTPRHLRIRHAALSAALLVASGAHTARADWQEFGPTPLGLNAAGRITAIAAHPKDNDIIYIGAATGGVWKRQGGKWTPLTDKLPALAIGALAIDPSDGNVIYAGSGEPNCAWHAFYGMGLYKSTDGGATWAVYGQDKFAGRSFSRILIHPTETQTLYAATTRAGGYSSLAGAKGHPDAQGAMGVFRSTDGGQTWTQLTQGLPNVPASDVALAPDDPKTLYAAIGNPYGDPANGIYKTTNGGDQWEKLEGGLPSGTARITLALAPSKSSRLYALIASKAGAQAGAATTLGVYITDDAGKTWARTNPGSLGDVEYYNTAIVDPKNPDVAFFGGMNLVRTSNKGGSYSDVTALHVDNHALAFNSAGDLLVGQDGGVNKSSNSGSSWTSLNAGIAENQIYPGISLHPKDKDFVLAGFQDNGIGIRGANGQWRVVSGGDGGYTAMHPNNPNVIIAQTQNGAYMRSTDGGKSFGSGLSGPSGTNAFYSPVVFSPEDPKVALLATNRVFRSTDSGATFSASSGTLSSAPIRALAISPANPQVVWAVTSDHKVHASSDGSKTFKQVLADGVYAWYRVTREIVAAPKDEKTAFLAVWRFGVNRVRMTTDLGATWTSLDGNLPDVPVNTVDAALVGNTEMVFAGTDQGVFFTCNRDKKWHRLGANLPNAVIMDVRYDPFFKRVVVASMARGVWAIDEPPVSACSGDDGTGGTGGGTGTGGRGTGGTGLTGGAPGGGNGGTGNRDSGGGGWTSGGSGGFRAGSGGIGAAGQGGSVGRGGGGNDSDPGGSCSCRMARSDGAAVGLLALLGLGLAGVRRRHRS